MESTYKINPFIFHELHDGDIVVQNKFGIFRFSDERIKDFLLKSEGKNTSSFNYQKIKSFFRDQTKEIIDVLLETKIIRFSNTLNFEIKNINFYSNNALVGSLISRSFEEVENFHCDRALSHFINKIDLNETELFVVFLNPYDKSLATKLRNKLKSNQNTYSIMSYVYNNKLFVDSIYSDRLKTPCHLCHIGFIESELRIGSRQRITYQQLIDSLFLEEKRFKVETPLRYHDALNIASQICNRIELLLSVFCEMEVEGDDFLQGLVMDIVTKECYVDRTHHWEMCDCYE
ncbi:McbB family protein [Pullulanibacillus sp. KACC 23026]|uniref:McbB family protein n=1 Tax=Pullulanibacillus sp. KACC 23026 TaxID=3028315 RepID=UPI0023AF6518|nr:McbB family protein [Pullulanibacillus sp. KACC 23026]WEG13650.1 McbB family protein [Pullulanibacillus sp. KACC 23026]